MHTHPHANPLIRDTLCSWGDARQPPKAPTVYTEIHMQLLTYSEFFAGAGFAGAGLNHSHGWRCVFANEIDKHKVQIWRDNAKDPHVMHHEDINNVHQQHIPASDLHWVSFPCQDVSLAGRGASAGAHTRTGTVWRYMHLLEQMPSQRRPRIIAFENVVNFASIDGGQYALHLMNQCVLMGYRVSMFTMDARDFVPQSRDRLFIVAVAKDIPIRPNMLAPAPQTYESKAVAWTCLDMQETGAGDDVIYWRLPAPPPRPVTLADCIEHPAVVDWHDLQQTRKHMAHISTATRDMLKASPAYPNGLYGLGYRRTRIINKKKRVVLELRNDGVAGCLRPPAGGSSRQFVVANILPELSIARDIRTRALTLTESRKIMGIPDTFVFNTSKTQALRAIGDGVAPPLVRYLSLNLFEPLLTA